MKRTLFLTVLFLFLFGCAGPQMYVTPVKPVVTETEAKEFPRYIHASYEPMPGEILKSDVYMKIIVRKNQDEQTFYGSGQFAELIKEVSNAKMVSSNLSGELSVGVIRGPVNRSKLNCNMMYSDKGKSFSSDCEEWTVPRFGLPDFPISPGNEWKETVEINDKNLGKAQVHCTNHFSRFVYLQNRLCARIEFEGQYKPQTEADKFVVFTYSGATYFDIGLREVIYSAGSISAQAVENKETVFISSEIVMKLDLATSIIKRSSITQFKN